MHLGYNTNGMAHHGLFDAVALLAEIGYRSVAITIDHGVLEPNGPETAAQLCRLGPMLEQLHMRSVIETGARFLLDPRHKHAPTLVSVDRADRERRIDFTRHAIDCAAALRSDCVSLWSGAADDSAPRAEAMDRLVEGLGEVLEYAQRRSVKIGFEPEPGMLIDSMERFEALLGRLDAESLGLTLDIGHLHCQGETPIAEYVRRWAPRLVNVHIEDMRAGVHEHLMFGQGEIDFPPVLRALAETRYSGGIHVELSRHGHEAPEAARRAMAFLRPMVKEAKRP